MLKFIKAFFAKIFSREETLFLEIVNSEKPLVIRALDGTEIISNNKELFSTWVDPNFKRWKLEGERRETKEIEVASYRPVKNFVFEELFSSLTDDLDELCLTSSQIVEFCKNYFDHKNYSTFFLMKGTTGKYFVVSVDSYEKGLQLFVYRFFNNNKRSFKHRFRFILPKLKNLSVLTSST